MLVVVLFSLVSDAGRNMEHTIGAVDDLCTDLQLSLDGEGKDEIISLGHVERFILLSYIVWPVSFFLPSILLPPPLISSAFLSHLLI